MWGYIPSVKAKLIESKADDYATTLEVGKVDEGLTTQDVMEVVPRRITRSMSRGGTSSPSSLSLFFISLL